MGFTVIFRCRPAIFFSLWVSLFGAVFATSINARELSAYDVMMKYDNRYNGDSSVGQYTMVLIDRRERQRVKIFAFTQKTLAKITKLFRYSKHQPT